MENVACAHIELPVVGSLGARTPRTWLAPRRALATLDSLMTVLALFGAYLALPFHGLTEPAPRLAHGLSLFCLALVMLGLLFHDGQYSSTHRLSPARDTIVLLRNLVVAYLVATGLGFATKGYFTGYTNLSRLAIVFGLALLCALMVASRVLLWRHQQRLFAKGEALRTVLVLGDGQAAMDFVTFLEHRPWLGVRCTGAIGLDPQGEQGLRTAAGTLVPFLGGLPDAGRLLREREADELVVALDPDDRHLLQTLASTCVAERLPFRVVPSLFEESYRPAKLAGFEELPVIDMAVDPLDRVQRTLKRALDLVLAGLVVVLGSPVFLACALAVKLTSPGPVLFRQERVGRHGAHFQMLKFRSMYVDAEERLAELEAQNEVQGHLFKIKNDPRVTRAGRFLRKSSLDELPQFFNVLAGHMSIVGPRPPLPREVDRYETAHFCRLRGTPGITGLWQVSGRSRLSFDEMVRLDRYYLDNWTVGFDLSLILRTVWVVLARDGAY